ncbi:diiron oxygenase [Modestobacter sp. Leaf380]|uniref:AurF N-oxygenase family protein n=1 Tax=Modestobacter sp. Leaf380 TaxID=1736356 RepID=UPI00070081B1|nr:diiron oxygenase [Modestobacter sp. Leaf380]KQS72150.1 hypothetical protein ASG41_19020 [Modestobacter sp. Leaf380]
MTSTLPNPTTDQLGAVFSADVRDGEEVSRRLLDSAAQLSYDPTTEVDWDAELDPAHHGLNPQWSTLYGTALWEEMTEQQRVTLTRHEVASIMSTGIWFEMILQQMLLREHYAADTSRADFQFALTEIADECRHSIMFARACSRMGITGYKPKRSGIELGRFFKTTANAETAFGGALVAEEVLDVMQRDWMRGEDVLPMIRTTSRIHVVEESRHMTFARQEMRESLAGVNPVRRRISALVIAIVTQVVVTNLVHRDVYAAASLDTDRAVREAAGNKHHQAMMRTSSRHLMTFLGECGLLTAPAVRIYRSLHML